MKYFIAVYIFGLSLNHSLGQTFNLRLQLDSGLIAAGRGVELLDSEYVFFVTWHPVVGSYRIGLFCLDNEGMEIWQKSYDFGDTSSTYVGYFGCSDRGENAFVSGGSIQTLNSSTRALLVEYSLTGDTIFTAELQLNDEEFYGRSAITLSDGFAICGGTTEGGNSNTSAVFLAKYDLAGQLLWKKIYSANGTIEGFSLMQTSDGGFLLGAASVFNLNYDAVLIKTNNEGTEQWRESYGTVWDELSASVVSTTSGSHYVFGGNEATNDLNGSVNKMWKVSEGGDVVWSHEYGEDGSGQGINSIYHIPTGGYVACGYDHPIGEDLRGFLLRTDEDGNEIWYRTFTQTESNWCYLTDVVQDDEGYFVCTGDLFPELDLTQDAWALRVDSCGCLVPGCGGDNCNVGVNELSVIGLHFIVGPNPADQFLNIYLFDQGILNDLRFDLVNMAGQVVRSFNCKFSDTTYMLDVADISPGLYVLVLNERGISVSTKQVEIIHP